jgi:hypothetical protein
MYPRTPRDHEIIEQMMGQFIDTKIVETCKDDSNWFIEESSFFS